MKNMENLVKVEEKREISSIFVKKLRIFKANLLWKLNFKRVIVWYQRKYKRNFEFDFINAQDLIDYTTMAWFTSLSKWLIQTSITGLILFYVLYIFGIVKLGAWFIFLALGIAYWTIIKFRKDLRG